MKFTTAQKKLRELANGEYFKIEYGITRSTSGIMWQECTVYVHGQDFITEQTWELALEKMRLALNPSVIKIDDIEELPGENNAE